MTTIDFKNKNAAFSSHIVQFIRDESGYATFQCTNIDLVGATGVVRFQSASGAALEPLKLTITGNTVSFYAPTNAGGISKFMLEITTKNHGIVKSAVYDYPVHEGIPDWTGCTYNHGNVNVKKVWSKRANTDPVYSSPIVAQFKQNGRLVVAHQAWDWKYYVRDFQTGDIMWDGFMSHELYGRPQAEDVNNDGLTEFFFASHKGEIRCYDENGQLKWEQFDEYTRQGKGSVSRVGSDGDGFFIQDSTKNWCDNLYMRSKWKPELNANVSIWEADGTEHVARIKQTKWNALYFAELDTTALTGPLTYQVWPNYESDIMFQHAGQLNKEGDKWYLYTTGFDNCCRKIDAATGAVIWVHASFEHCEPYPLLFDLDKDGTKELFYSSVDWNVYCLNIADGTEKWVYAAQSGNDAFLNTLKHSDGSYKLVVSSRDHRVHLVNADGTLHDKTTTTHADIDSRPVVYDFNNDGKEEFIFGGDSGYVYCCDENCNTLWRKNIGIYLNSSAIMADVNYDGKMEVLIGDMNGDIHILDPITGNTLHQMHFKGSVEGTPTIGDFDGDGKVELVATSCDGYVEMFRFE